MKIIVDHNQKRLKNDIQNLVFSMEDIDNGASEVAVQDPVAGMAMLRPFRLDTAWYGLSTGNYYKLGLSDITTGLGVFNTSSIPSVAAGPWFGLGSSYATGIHTGAWMKSNTSYPKNVGIVLSAFNYGGSETASSNALISIGYGTMPSVSTLHINIFPQGDVDVYRNQALYKSGTISAYTPTNAATSANTNQTQTGKNSDTFYDIMVMPYNQNQLLIQSLNGGSFVVNFDDLLLSDIEPTICPAGPIWVYIPTNRPAKFQWNALGYNSQGSVLSQKMNFIIPPVTGTPLNSYTNDTWIGIQSYRVYGYGVTGVTSAGTQARNWANSSAFVPDSSTTQARLRIYMSTTNPYYSPTVIGGQIAYAGTYATTPDSQIDITQWCQTLTLDVPEDPSASSIRFKIVELGVARTQVSSLTTQLNRPIKVLDDNNINIFEGVITQLDYHNENNFETLEVTAKNRFHLLDNYIFRDRVPLANELVWDSINFLASKCGSINTIYVPSPVVKVSFAAASKADDWGTMIVAGDTAGNKLREIFDTYAGNWGWGFYPGDLFLAKPLSQFTTAHTGLTSSRATALAAGLSTSAIYFNLDQHVLDPEANDVRVTGYDPRRNHLIQAFRQDLNSKSITTSVVTRPDNWLGYEKVYGLLDPAITDIGICSYAVDLLWDRLSKKRYLYEFDSYYLTKGSGASTSPIWRGDLIPITGIGTVRVVAVNFQWMKASIVRATYTTELVR